MSGRNQTVWTKIVIRETSGVPKRERIGAKNDGSPKVHGAIFGSEIFFEPTLRLEDLG